MFLSEQEIKWLYHGNKCENEKLNLEHGATGLEGFAELRAWP